MNPYYQYRRDNHLCVDCGEKAADGKSRCYRCLQIIAVKQRERDREHAKDPEYREKRQKYLKEWQENNPEKMAVYKSRKSMSNRKYLYGEDGL